MNEAERAFLEDVKEKKQIARGAAGKRSRAPRSTKCTLPHETMTADERKRYMAASEITTFTLRPMTLAEFKGHTADKQMELLKWYGEKFGWTAASVAFALDCSHNSAKKLLESYMLTSMFRVRQETATPEQLARCNENRKAVKNALEKARQEDDASTHPEAVNAPQSETERLQMPFTVTIQADVCGRDLARYLNGVGHSLSTGRKYAVRLVVTELPETEDGEGDVVDA